MDNLEQFFRERKDAFEVEPDSGHFERFEAKLDKLQGVSKKRKSGFLFLKVAAALIVVLLSANLIVQLLPEKNTQSASRVPDPELNEAIRFYTVRINSGLGQLRQMADQGLGTTQELQLVNKELTEMDSLYHDLQAEYSRNPNDERIVNAMISYYQTKLEIVNTIKTDLEKVKNIKKAKNENTQL